MSDASTPPNAGDTKSCKICAETIKKSARVCIHCNSYQDWRADLSISSTVLSLLVALTSVLTVAVPILIAALTPKDSKFALKFEGGSKAILSVFVTNLGARPGAVGLHATFQCGKTSFALQVPKTDHLAKIIEPSKSDLIEFEYVPSDSDQIPDGLPDDTATYKEIEKSKCFITMSVTEYSGERFFQDVDSPYAEIDMFIYTAFSKHYKQYNKK